MSTHTTLVFSHYWCYVTEVTWTTVLVLSSSTYFSFLRVSMSDTANISPYFRQYLCHFSNTTNNTRTQKCYSKPLTKNIAFQYMYLTTQWYFQCNSQKTNKIFEFAFFKLSLQRPIRESNISISLRWVVTRTQSRYWNGWFIAYPEINFVKFWMVLTVFLERFEK